MVRSSQNPSRFWMIVCYLTALVCACAAMGNDRLPFWAEKSTYIEGDRIYAVGISRVQKDVAEARQEAFDRGLLELMNMLQVSDLGKLTLNTQRTVEVPKEEGVQVYRLVWVSAEEANSLKESRGRLTRETLLRQTESMKRLRDELYPVLQQHQQAATSLSELERQANETADLHAYRREQIRGAAGAIERRIASRSAMVCELKRDMSEDEVRALVGEPDQTRLAGKWPEWRYGRSTIRFSREGKVLELRLARGLCE